MKMKSLFIVCIALVPCPGYPQNSRVDQRQPVQSLPSAPMPQPVPNHPASSIAPNGHRSSESQVNPGTQMFLSLKEAEALALKNNPQISVARLTALACQQVTPEVRSSLWPPPAGALP